MNKIHDTENDRYIGKCIARVVTPTEQKGFGFLKDVRKVEAHGNGSRFVQFEQHEKIFIQRDVFVHHLSIIPTEGSRFRQLLGDEIVMFDLYYNGKRGAYGVNVKKIDSILDENGYPKDLSYYGY